MSKDGFELVGVEGERTKKAGIHVALLRGINLGGKHRVPMKSLETLFVEAGCAGVRTYIQSGNVVFEAKDALARRIPALIGEAIWSGFRFRVPVITRTAAEIRGIARGNPFLRRGADTKTLHVAFLADEPSAAKAARLDPERSPLDRFEVRGREIYLHLPNGVARTKLTNQYFDSTLGTTSTLRNWRTVLKLLELVAGDGPEPNKAAPRAGSKTDFPRPARGTRAKKGG